jgi:tRNA threonylcarbamoyladenosine biosynthesis protein TsaB
MKILAIETSTRVWSVALLDQDQVAACPDIDRNLPISRALIPMIQTGVAQAGWRPEQLNLIAVSAGPGAFTGLRIGITAAKTIAYALHCPLVACHSLGVLAAAAAQAEDWPLDLQLCPVIPAERGEMFVSTLRFARPWQPEFVKPISVALPASISESLPRDAVLTGPGLSRWPNACALRKADSNVWDPSAEILGHLAREKFRRGETDDPFHLVPHYHRPSYAEEKRSE